MKRFLGGIIVFILAQFHCLSGQFGTSTINTNNLTELFANGQYAQVIEKGNILLNSGNSGPDVDYFLGRSYLVLNSNAQMAVDHLKYAAKEGYNTEVHFYLAQAYYNNYQPGLSKISLENYMFLAKRREIKNHNIDAWFAQIERLKNQTSEFDIPKVFAQKTIDSIAIGCNGIKQNSDLKFVCEKSKNGDWDIFMVSENVHGEMEKVAATINTNANEISPYFSEKYNMLYFASDRDGGLGGYDVYAAPFNTTYWNVIETKHFNFPINTPSNEFAIYEVKEVFRLITNRNTTGTKLNEIVFDLSESEHIVAEPNVNLKKMAALQPVVNEPSPKDMVIDQITGTTKKPPLPVQNQRTEKSRVQTESNIAQGLALQFQIDSIDNVITAFVKQQLESNSNEQKNILMKQIVQLQHLQNNLKKQSINLLGGAQMVTEPASENKMDETETTTGKDKTEELAIYIAGPEKHVGSNNPQQPNKKVMPNTLPNGLVYQIQLGVYSQSIEQDKFNGLEPVFLEELNDKNLYKYLFGLYNNASDANNAVKTVKEKGFKDAFLVSYYNREKIPIQKAREIEFSGQ